MQNSHDMKERPPSISGLKSKYIQHILDAQNVSPGAPSSLEEAHMHHRGQPPRRPESTCNTKMGCTFCDAEAALYPSDENALPRTEFLRQPPPTPPMASSDALAEEALSMLSEAEKNEIILQMHHKLRHLSRRVEEVSAISERTVRCLERAHRDALRERMLSEQRIREELLQWKHQNPEVAELRAENRRLREENDQNQRQYLALLRKLARRHKLLKTAL